MNKFMIVLGVLFILIGAAMIHDGLAIMLCGAYCVLVNHKKTEEWICDA